MPELRTCGSGSGLSGIPTPTRSDSRNTCNSTAVRHKIPPSGIHAGDTLVDFVKKWPTPKASDGARGDCPSERKRNTPGLMSAVKLWPTPRASANENRQTKLTPSQLAGKHGLSLCAVVNMEKFPTPMASEARQGYQNRNNGKKGTQQSLTTVIQGGRAQDVGGALNPVWVEWLMGWPLGWTDLRRLEMGRFQAWRRSHGGCWQKTLRQGAPETGRHAEA